MVRSKRELWKAFGLVVPSLAVISVFVYAFIAWSVRTSFSAWKGMVPDYTFVGLRNYFTVFSRQRFQIDLMNTLSFTVSFLLLCVVIGILLAWLIDRNIRGEGIFRTIYLFPMSVSFVVTGVVWRWIFNPTVGINALLRQIGLGHLAWGWYTDPTRIGIFHIALIPVIIAASWQLSGYTMAMFLAGFRGIPSELTEQARIDGAGEFFILRKIYLPMLRPITLSALIVLGHFSLKIFDLVFTMTGSGPAFATDVPAIYMFETTFRGNNYGEGAVISIVMLLMVAVVIVPYLASTFRKE